MSANNRRKDGTKKPHPNRSATQPCLTVRRGWVQIPKESHKTMMRKYHEYHLHHQGT